MNKIAIYTICKNEEKHVADWVQNTTDADYIIVGDTGSDDNTIERLKNNDIMVHNLSIKPWRFDEARNDLLEHLPEDVSICISLDFDERLSEGWRAAIEKAWSQNTTRLHYYYREHRQGSEKVIMTSKIHSRHGYKWVYPVHEVLKYDCQAKKEVDVFCSGLEIIHTPDEKKTRTNYLPLQQIAAEENPDIFRIHHQLGREYFWKKEYDKAIKSFLHGQCISKSKEQLHISFLFLAKTFQKKGESHKSEEYLKNALSCVPQNASAYIEYANLLYTEKKWRKLSELSVLCDQIDLKYRSVYDEGLEGLSRMYDQFSMAWFHLKNHTKALAFADLALSLDKSNDRIQNNYYWFQNIIREQEPI